MDLEPVLPFALAFLSLTAFQLGMSVRARVHVLLPWKDPITLTLMLVAFSPFIGDYLGCHILDTSNMWYLAALLAFVCSYSLAYIRGEFEMMYVAENVITSPEYPNGCTHVVPIVYYYFEDRLFLQEQSLKEILKTTIFGIRSPLDFPMDRVYRTNPVIVEKIYFPVVSVDKVDMVYKDVSEEIITKFHLKFKVRSYKYTAAPYCTDSSRTWMVERANQDAMQRQLIRDQAALFNSKQEAMSAKIAQAGDMLEILMADHTPEADVFAELADKLKPTESVRIPSKDPFEGKRRIMIEDDEDEEENDDE